MSVRRRAAAETVSKLVTSPHTTLPVDTPPLVAVKVQSRLSQSSGPAEAAPVMVSVAPVSAHQGHHGVRGLFAAVFRHRKELDLSHPFVSLAKPGGESGRIPTLARARLEASTPGRWRGRASMPGRNVALGIEAGRAIKRGWASQYSLGEPVLGEPSNEVGASHQTRLGEPVLRGRWASQCYVLCLLGVKSARLATQRTPLQQCPPLHLHSGLPLVQRPPLSQWPTPAPAWRCACSAHLQVPARHIYLGACSAHLQVPARHIYLGACSAHLPRCLLGTST